MESTFYLSPGAEHAQAYEYLNLYSDPEQRLEQVMWTIAGPQGKVLLDIGAGSGFHALRYAALARRVFALEPDADLLRQMFARFSNAPHNNLNVLASGAEDIPLPNNSVDIAIARFAYFFGTRACLPGLAEVRRVLRSSGCFFIIDADPDHGQFGALARQAYPDVFHDRYTRENQVFYEKVGFRHSRVDSVFRAPDRDVLRAVFRMDYPRGWEELLEQVQGTELTYSFMVYYWKPVFAAA